MYRNKKVLAVVPARGGSKGVPLKNIQPIKNIPLVGWVGRCVGDCPFIDRAVVSTDSDEIAAAAEAYGLSVPFRRPEALSGDRVADFPVLEHALLQAEELDGCIYDIILMLQPTSPLRQPRHIEASIEKLLDGKFDSVWTVSETDSKAHPLKQLTVSASSDLDYYDQKGKEIIARQQLSPVYHRNGACYAFTRECLVGQKTIKGEKAGAVITEPMVSIDTTFDFKLVEFLLDNQEAGLNA